MCIIFVCLFDTFTRSYHEGPTNKATLNHIKAIQQDIVQADFGKAEFLVINMDDRSALERSLPNPFVFHRWHSTFSTVVQPWFGRKGQKQTGQAKYRECQLFLFMSQLYRTRKLCRVSNRICFVWNRHTSNVHACTMYL